MQEYVVICICVCVMQSGWLEDVKHNAYLGDGVCSDRIVSWGQSVEYGNYSQDERLTTV